MRCCVAVSWYALPAFPSTSGLPLSSFPPSSGPFTSQLEVLSPALLQRCPSTPPLLLTLPDELGPPPSQVELLTRRFASETTRPVLKFQPLHTRANRPVAVTPAVFASGRPRLRPICGCRSGSTRPCANRSRLSLEPLVVLLRSCLGFYRRGGRLLEARGSVCAGSEPVRLDSPVPSRIYHPPSRYFWL